MSPDRSSPLHLAWLRAWIRRDILGLLQDTENDAARPFDVVAVTDADVVLPAALRERGIHEHRVGVQLTVRDDGAPSVVRLDERRAGLDIFDRFLVLVEADLIANLERAGDQDEDAGEKVLEDIIEGKADGDAADAEWRGRGSSSRCVRDGNRIEWRATKRFAKPDQHRCEDAGRRRVAACE